MITEGYLARHYQGRADGRDPALIDIAQDYALRLLHEAGVFGLGVVLKGGTAVRKYRAGNAGRFSTDLDFAGADETTAEVILDVLDGAELDGFRFEIEPLHAHRRARLRLETPFGSPAIPARVDLSPKPAWLVPEVLGPTALPIHTRYSFPVPPIPVMRLEEVASEKLARYRRASLARDLYDLAWMAQRVFDEHLVRRLTVLKVWHDVVDDRLGEQPFHPEDVLRPRQPKDFDPEAIGYLTTPVDVLGWIGAVGAPVPVPRHPRRRRAPVRSLQPRRPLADRPSCGRTRWSLTTAGRPRRTDWRTAQPARRRPRGRGANGAARATAAGASGAWWPW